MLSKTITNRISQRIGTAPRANLYSTLVASRTKPNFPVQGARSVSYRAYRPLFDKHGSNPGERDLLNHMMYDEIPPVFFSSQADAVSVLAILKKYPSLSPEAKISVLQFSQPICKLMQELLPADSALLNEILIEVNDHPMLQANTLPVMSSLLPLFCGKPSLILEILRQVTTLEHVTHLHKIYMIIKDPEYEVSDSGWLHLIRQAPACKDNYEDFYSALRLLSEKSLPIDQVILCPESAAFIANSYFFKDISRDASQEHMQYKEKCIAKEILSNLQEWRQWSKVLGSIQRNCPRLRLKMVVKDIKELRNYLQHADLIDELIRSLNDSSTNIYPFHRILAHTSLPKLCQRYLALADCGDGKIETNRGIINLLWDNLDSNDKIQELIQDYRKGCGVPLTTNALKLIEKQLKAYLTSLQSPTSPMSHSKSSIGFFAPSEVRDYLTHLGQENQNSPK